MAEGSRQNYGDLPRRINTLLALGAVTAAAAFAGTARGEHVLSTASQEVPEAKVVVGIGDSIDETAKDELARAYKERGIRLVAKNRPGTSMLESQSQVVGIGHQFKDPNTVDAVIFELGTNSKVRSPNAIKAQIIKMWTLGRFVFKEAQIIWQKPYSLNPDEQSRIDNFNQVLDELTADEELAAKLGGPLKILNWPKEATKPVYGLERDKYPILAHPQPSAVDKYSSWKVQAFMAAFRRGADVGSRTPLAQK